MIVVYGVELIIGLYCYWYFGVCYDKVVGGGFVIGYDYMEWMVGVGWCGVLVKLWMMLLNYFGFDGNLLVDGIDYGSCGFIYVEVNWVVFLLNNFMFGLYVGYEYVCNYSVFSFIDYCIEFLWFINKFLMLFVVLIGVDVFVYVY